MILTKELKVQTLPTGRKVRISSNLLRGFGFTPETRLGTEQLGQDLILRPQPDGPFKVHERGYADRPRETVIELASQDLINRILPSAWDRIHFTFRPESITLRPLAPQLFAIRKSFRHADSLNAFMALSSGLDASVFKESGFRIRAALDWRPNEARDSKDLTESGLQTFLANHNPDIVINEDLASCNPQDIAALVKSRIGPIATLSIGLQCDDWSNCKSPALKRIEMAEFRPSSRELGYYATKLIEALTPASVFIENVPGWHGSDPQAVLGAVLARLGYHVQAKVLNSADFGAYTARNRCYFVASIFPGFRFPEPTGRNTVPLRSILRDEIPRMRDVSHTKTIAKAVESNRSRFTSLDATAAPTLLKSQGRMTKDSLYFQGEDGRLLYPTTKALRILQGVPDTFDLTQVNNELAIEQLGQGIDFPLHRAVATALHEHLRINKIPARAP